MRFVLSICLGTLMGLSTSGLRAEENVGDNSTQGIYEIATFAGGCFWCMQPVYDGKPGVVSTRVGYAGGKEENPSYEQVASGKTGHAEAVLVTFDPKKTSYEALLGLFWKSIDPTQADGQFADRGPQYRTAIFYHSEAQRLAAEHSKKRLEESAKFSRPIVTEISPATDFYQAEEYHQEYYKKESVRYKLYKVGSGRAGFLEKTWGEEGAKGE